MDSPKKHRCSYMLQSDFERLEEWCRNVRQLFHNQPYFVSSAAGRSDFRDVDIRLIVRDEEFDSQWNDIVKVRLMNRAISIWGQQETGLPIDFQIQRMTEANVEFGDRPRNAMGSRRWESIPTSGVPKPTG